MVLELGWKLLTLSYTISTIQSKYLEIRCVSFHALTFFCLFLRRTAYHKINKINIFFLHAFASAFLNICKYLIHFSLAVFYFDLDVVPEKILKFAPWYLQFCCSIYWSRLLKTWDASFIKIYETLKIKLISQGFYVSALANFTKLLFLI